MSAAAILNQCRAAGVSVWLEGERLKFKAAAPLPAGLLADLKAHKPELIVLLSVGAANDHGKGEAASPFTTVSKPNEQPSPESVREWFRERLAIICEASELDPDEAYALAVDRTLRHFWQHRTAIVELLKPLEV